jgi:DNA repair ATPase RecN
MTNTNEEMLDFSLAPTGSDDFLPENIFIPSNNDAIPPIKKEINTYNNKNNSSLNKSTSSKNILNPLAKHHVDGIEKQQINVNACSSLNKNTSNKNILDPLAKHDIVDIDKLQININSLQQNHINVHSVNSSKNENINILHMKNDETS